MATNKELERELAEARRLLAIYRAAAANPVFTLEVVGKHYMNADDSSPIAAAWDADFSDWPDGVTRLMIIPDEEPK